MNFRACRLALVLTCAPFAAQAQAPSPLINPANGEPIEIQADSGIEWQQNTKTYIARGNAVAIRGVTEVHANTLIAHYREAKGGNTGGNSEIYRLDADGNVTIKKEGQTIVGDHAVYDVDQAVGVITGKGLKMTTATDIVTARDRFDWYDQKQIAVARGDAVAIRNGKTIRADVLTGYLTKTPAAAAPGKPAPAAKPAPPKPTPAAAAKPGAPGPEMDAKLNRIDAQGHVVVTNGPDVGQGDYGVYNAQTGIVSLIGNAVITRDKDVIKGQYAVMDLNSNVSRMMPSAAAEPGQHQRVRGLFIRRDATGGPAAASPAAASPAAGAAPAATPGKTP